MLFRSGEIYAKLGSEKREKISYDEMSQVLIDAIIATEDSRFFQHNGFDLPRFIKASIGQLLGKDAGGASTLTMQVAKTNFTSTEATGIEGFTMAYVGLDTLSMLSAALAIPLVIAVFPAPKSP